MSAKIKVLPNLYPLRFILAVFVIIFHLPQISRTLGIPFFNDWPLFHKGIQAVYYFFTLSGFLIIRIIYKEIKHSGTFGFKRFYIRRIQRLYPVYYLVLIVGVGLYHIILPAIGIPFEINYSLGELLASYVFLIPNVFKYYHPDIGGILDIMWSIGVEEQFYLLMPVFLYFTKKNMKASLSILLAVSVAVLFVYPPFYKYQNLYFYFMAGGLFSVLSFEKKYSIFNSKLLHTTIYLLFIIVFFTDWLSFDNFIAYQLLNLFISTLLILLVSDYPIFEVDNKLLTYLGKVSYGIYMYHFIVITAVLFAVQQFPIHQNMNDYLFIGLLNIVVISGTAIVSHISYQYFEKLFYKSRD